MKASSNKVIGLLTFPIGNAGITPVGNFVDILKSFSEKTFLVTGNNGYDYFKNDERMSVYGITHQSNLNVFKRMINYGYTQLKITLTVLKIDRKPNLDLWIFFIGSECLLLPMLALRIFRKKVFLVLAGSSVESSYFKKDPLLIFIKILTSINYALSSRIIVYSKSLIDSFNLIKYKSKISVAHEHIIKLKNFRKI